MSHQLERTEEGLYRCVVCQWAWLIPPRTECPGYARYLHWDDVPPCLMSATMLRRGGL
jgi:hypothetical protein